MDRFTISEALDYVENTKWAYATIDGLLRCPDCNSNLDCTWEEDYDHYPFHANEADGACSAPRAPPPPLRLALLYASPIFPLSGL